MQAAVDELYERIEGIPLVPIKDEDWSAGWVAVERTQLLECC